MPEEKVFLLLQQNHWSVTIFNTFCLSMFLPLYRDEILSTLKASLTIRKINQQ